MSVAASTAIGLGVAAGTAGGAAWAGHEAASANKDAAQKQLEANQAALDFAKQRYAQSQANQAPYMAAGSAATGGISNLLQAAARKQGYGYTPPSGANGIGLSAIGGTPSAGQTAQMVTLKGPDGSTKQVPSDQADHWIKLGAQPVQ